MYIYIYIVRYYTDDKIFVYSLNNPINVTSNFDIYQKYRENGRIMDIFVPRDY